MKEEAVKRHRELTAEMERLYRRVMNTLEKMEEVSHQREIAALHYCGAAIGDIVRLKGARHKGQLARIEDSMVRNPDFLLTASTKLGDKPTIAASPLSSRWTKNCLLFSGNLWELVEPNGRQESSSAAD